MKFCSVCRLYHRDDSPLCEPYGRLVTEEDGSLRYEPPGGGSDCRSANANDAEDEGRMPLTRAIRVVAHRAGCSRADAKAALIRTHEGEWHHTGLFSRRTQYYSVVDAVTYLKKK